MMRALAGIVIFGTTLVVGQTRPNIILIMTDDHAKNATSIYGSQILQTPNIDRIGKEGAVFRNAFVTNSICGPSRAVQLTGVYSHINGLKDNRDQDFDGSQLTLPKVLQGAGYYTMIVGKWHLGSEPTGFDYWSVLVGQGEYYNPRFIDMGDTIRTEGYVTEKINEVALARLDSVRDQPFLLLLHQKSPHRNWMPDARHFPLFDSVDLPVPETFYDDYSTRSDAAREQDMEIRNMYRSFDLKLYLPEGEKDPGSGGKEGWDGRASWESTYAKLTEAQKAAWDTYYKPISDAFYKRGLQGKELEEWMYQRYIKDYLRCVVSVDENIGELLDYLEGRGILDETVILYTSDQGFFLGEHGWYDKRFMYEESIGIPLLMRYPAAIPAGTVVDRIVLNLDIPATLIDLAGAAIPDRMQGESMMRVVRDTADVSWRRSMYYHYYEFPHGWHNVKRHYGIRTERYKLIHFYNDIDDWELYDLQKDPFEVMNLHGKQGTEQLTRGLKEELNRLQVKFGDTGAD